MQSKFLKRTQILVRNILPSGCGFALAVGDGETVFIPIKVVRRAGIKVGDLVEADLHENPKDRESVPYMACYVEPTDAAPAEDQAYELPANSVESVKAIARETVFKGGVWTLPHLFQVVMNDKKARREDHLTIYNAINSELRSLHRVGKIAKVSLRHSGTQTKSGRDWYTAFPNAIRVMAQ